MTPPPPASAPPPPEHPDDVRRQRQVEETLRALAAIQPPPPGPEVTSAWRNTVDHAALLPSLNDAAAAAAESVLSGGASLEEQTEWHRQSALHPVLMDGAAFSGEVDRALSRLPEVHGVTPPPEVLTGFRRTLEQAVAQPCQMASAPPESRRNSRRGVFVAGAWAAAAAVLVAGGTLAYRTISFPSACPASPPPAPLVLLPPRTEPAPPEVKRVSPPTPASAPSAPEAALAVSVPAGKTGPEIIEEPLPASSETAAVPLPEAPQPAPPPGSLESLRPVLLARLTGGGGGAGSGPGPASGPEEVWRSPSAGPSADLPTVFRSAGSSHLTDEGNEQFVALALVLQEAVLADEPYFIVEDHSQNDLDVSLRRAAAVCAVLTKFGVETSRLRPGGKGRFERRPGDPADGRHSRITVRPASARFRYSPPASPR